MQKRRTVLWLIIFITLIAIIVDLPKIPVKINFAGQKITSIGGWNIDFKIGKSRIFRDLSIKQGLDLQGGTHLAFQADMKGIGEKDKDSAVESARAVIQRRVDLFGVSEPVVQSAKVGEDYRILVDLPGIKDVNRAIELIGKTAQLEFKEPLEGVRNEATASASQAAYRPTGLTGADLKRSDVTFSSTTGEPEVSLEFTDKGAKLFGDITGRNVGKRVAIFLDNGMVSDPLVNEQISGGKAVISGNFTSDRAKELSIQLNAGALPVPIRMIEQDTVEATLGQDSVNKSIFAGVVGLLIVGGFMWAYYGKLGFLAVCALIIYGILTLAIYKFIPVTLTLPGIAGFLLSMGMAVDSNILIFERMKEERRMGKPLSVAMELGFDRAWNSIRDANVCTIITSFILFNPFNWSFLNSSGMVRGFALTLLIGILLSLFTGIVVSRTLIRVFYRDSSSKLNLEKKR